MKDNLPTLIYAVKKIGYTATSLVDLDNDEEVTLQNMVEMALEYASEDLNDSTISHYLIAEYHDESGKTIKTEEYDWEGKLIGTKEDHTVIDDSNLIQNDGEFTVSLGPDYVDPDAYGSYVCAVANDFRTMHVVALNGKDDPVFQVLDDQGAPIHPFYPTLNLAIIAAKGWLS